MVQWSEGWGLGSGAGYLGIVPLDDQSDGSSLLLFSQFTFIPLCRILHTLPLQLNGCSNIHIVTKMLNGKII